MICEQKSFSATPLGRLIINVWPFNFLLFISIVHLAELLVPQVTILYFYSGQLYCG